MSDIKRCDYCREEIDISKEYFKVSIESSMKESCHPMSTKDCCPRCASRPVMLMGKPRIGRPRGSKTKTETVEVGDGNSL